MQYQRTQIYLPPEEHRRLSAQAAARGISLAALMREIVSSHVREQAAPYATKSWDSLLGIIDEDVGEPTDIARDEEQLKAAAWDARALKKMRAPAKRTARPRRKGTGGR
jgi:hypothetical protein